MMIDRKYYERFPTVLSKALISEIVKFPDTLNIEYEALDVYRGVKYKSTKTQIDESDFKSQIERNQSNPMVVANEAEISDYSCSCYTDINSIKKFAKFPRKNMAIAMGRIVDDYGPIDIEEETTHVHLFLYKGVDPSEQFKVVEIWEKNG